ncbi:MAG: phosphoglucosamine mutase [Acetobacteraceae bacterium]|nr:phosphoglucosamine mutase [Acetobacteraceae bacterium]
MPRLFGTDGVRGVANADLSPELAFRLGRAGAFCLSRGARRPRVVVGRDTRASGELLEAAVVAGLCSVGADAARVGVITTPGVAYLVRRTKSDAGVVISASHNPAEYNGIKFFSAQGYKLPDDLEDQVERLALDGAEDLPSPTGAGVGRVLERAADVEEYLRFLVGSAACRLDGLRVVVDCANGAASTIAPRVLEELGARVTPINCRPDGHNINLECGSTCPAALQRAVRELGADVGLAHDGDADRLIAVDEKGQVVDGDGIMVVCGLHLHSRGQLGGGTVVTTIMSNLGLDRALAGAGLKVLRTQVGDRYVLEAMLARGLTFGGEQSGHIILLDRATTGDGILTALVLLEAMQESGQPLSKLAARMERLPQQLVNVPVVRGARLDGNARVDAARRGAEARGLLVNVRTSGTESAVVRVLVQGQDAAEVAEAAEELAAVIREELGGERPAAANQE